MKIYEDLSGGAKNISKFLFIIGLALLTLFGASLVIYYSARAASELVTLKNRESITISASGEGLVFLKPDIAVLSLTVKTMGLSLASASDENNQKSNKVTQFLKAQGISENDIKTTQYNVSPQYDYGYKPCYGNVCPARGTPKIVGYEVTNTVEAKVRSMDKVSSILDGAVSAGANEISGPVFKVDDPVKAQGEAREKAIAQAKESAQKIADNLGLKLGDIKNFSESGAGIPMYDYAMGRGGAGMGVSAALPASIEPGQSEIKSTVTVTFEARD